MINSKEIKKIMSMLILGIGMFYLVFPLRNLINNIIFDEVLKEHVVGQIIVGIIILIIGGTLFDWE